MAHIEAANKKKHISTIDLMRVNTSDLLEHMYPQVPCHQCKKIQWSLESAPLTWSCICCGNLIYIELGVPVQQIDIVRKFKKERGEE